MAQGPSGETLRLLRTLFEAGTLGDLSDGQLLERFTAGGGEAAEHAFAALVARHGPMVLRVGRALLRDEHAAEDAFQATFLVLATKARSLRVRDSLGPWLHQVARRVAACARSAAARRHRHEKGAAQMARRSTEPGAAGDLGPALHEEVDRLPERYRKAVVICDLEGQTTEQAARHLGWPVGTVRSRLARGRERLRGRLTRRGLAPSAGLLGLASAAEAAPAAMPAALVVTTVRAAMQVAAGGAVAGVVPVAVSTMTREALKAMFLMKLRAVALVLGTIGVTTGGLGAMARAVWMAPDTPRGEAEAPEDPGLRDQERLQGGWTVVALEVAGRPIDPVTDVSGVEFKGDRMISFGGGIGVVHPYTIDPTERPKAIDIRVGEGVHRAIYRLEGDDLNICFPDPERGGDRPNAFATGHGVGHRLMTLRRVAPEAQARVVIDTPADSIPSGDRARFGEEEARGEGPGPEVRDTAPIRGRWEVLYVAGTAAGNREGYSWPDLVVSATDKTINLPALTGKPNGPLKDLGAMSYTLDPGLKEAKGRVESAQEDIEWIRSSLRRLTKFDGQQDPVRQATKAESQARSEEALIDARARLEAAEAVMRNAERRRGERKGEGAEESRIDLEAGAGGGKALRGIYRLKDDILTICYDEADRGRPGTFAAGTASEGLIILRRVPQPISHPGPRLGGGPPVPTRPDAVRSR